MKNNKVATQTPQELLSELRALVVEAERMVAGSISEHTADAVSALRSRYHAAHERMGEIYDDTRKKVVAGAKQTDRVIRDNPYQTIAIAAGVALVLGLLLGRNRQS
ncbi:MAG TPA: hypothetical protein VG734_06260 [Lacunisphaera sp.]|nr:hypothetical protein [Lacunisphaera sp.]